MKYYILAGEASGDLHGANLIKALKKNDSDAMIRCWGGDLMEKAGAALVIHYKNRSFMGFLEVLLNIFKILKFIKFCKKDIQDFHPDKIIFIDNSGFNLRIAKWAKKNNYQTNYYISPQIWASRQHRVEAIKRDIDQMFVILPFEKYFYKKFNYEVSFVGHPLLDEINNLKKVDEASFRARNNLSDKPIVALLPGSRKQEIKKILGVMLELTNDFDDYHFVIAGAPSQNYEFYKKIIGQREVAYVAGQTYDLLACSYLALVASGTATLEAALLRVPQIVCYKTSWLSYQIGKRIVKLKFISLVNLIMDKEVVKELIQDNFTKKNLLQSFLALLDDKKRNEILKTYTEIEEKLGSVGASENVAKQLLKG
jgi:lipid-A-disaccharide synthase